MKMKKTAAIAVLVAILLMITACGNSGSSTGASGGDQGGKTIRIAWWGSDTRHSYTQQVIDLYKKQNPGVNIDVEYASFDDYWKKLAPQAAANQLPDIIQMDISYISQYAKNGQLEDLKPYIGNGIKLDDVSESVISTGVIGGTQYGIPAGVNVLGYQYNPELLKKAGINELPADWTWDDYEKLALQAKDKGIYFDESMTADVFFNYYLRTKGASLYNAQGTGLGYEDDALFADFFGRLAKLMKEGATPSQETLSQNKGILEESAVVKGTAIGTWQWSNQFVALQKVSDRPMALAPMLGPDMEKGIYMQPSMYWAISKNSQSKDEAAKFIDFWINNEEANKLIKGERGVPISSKIKEAITPELTDAEKQVFDFVSKMEPIASPMSPPPPVGSAEVIASLSDYVEQINFGQMTAADAAAKFRADANSILANNQP